MTDLRSALAFLTILRVPNHNLAPADLAGAGRWFALVGAMIGILLAGLAWLAARLWPPDLAAGLVLAGWVLVTGGLHLDGALDSFDALAAAVPPARRLEILRDVHTGAFGVIGGVVLLLLKWAALAPLVTLWPVSLVLAPAAGRAAMAWAQHHWPYARAEGLGRLVPAAPRGLLFNAIPLALVAVALGWRGILAASLGLVVAHGLAGWMAGRLGGGLTGDCYGALCEITELATLLGLALRIGSPG